jgi:hypothetical protein
MTTNRWRVAFNVVLYVVSYLTSTYVIYAISTKFVRSFVVGSMENFSHHIHYIFFYLWESKLSPNDSTRCPLYVCYFVFVMNKAEIIVNLLSNINHSIIRTPMLINRSISMLFWH